MSVGFCNNQLSSLENIGQICIKSGKSGLPIPNKVAKSMINLIPDDWFDVEPYMNGNTFDKDAYTESHRVIDICCNSGVLLEHFYYKFMQELNRAISNSDEREDYILQNLLYAFCLDSKLVRLLRMRLYWSSKCKGHIYQYDIVNNTGRDLIRVRSVLENMKFDIVVGNPPYNNDVYIDFVLKGHGLAKSYDLWITPAKFINKQSDNDDKMRADIVPYISNFIYYPEHKDVFDIMLRGGLGIYLVRKTVTDYAVVENKSKNCKLFNGVVNRALGSILLNIGYSLDKRINSNTSLLSDRLNLNKRYYLNEYETGHSIKGNNDVAIVQGGKGIIGYIDKSDLKTDYNIDKYKIVFPSMCGAAEIDSNGKILGLNEVYILEPYEVSKGGYPTACFFDTKNEAESFRKFMFTKFFRFLYYIKVTSSNINATFFSSIPDPGSFDRIFEDKPLDGYTPDENGEYIDSDGNKHCSLYVKYKLTKQEIDIIESVIRERK